MKKLNISIINMFTMILCCGVIKAQAPYILDEGDDHIQCVTEEQYQQYIRPGLRENINKLRSEGKLNFANDGAVGKLGDGTVPLSWPLRLTGDYKDLDGVNDYFVVSNFADLNHDEYYRLDWACNTYESARNYDQHNGADIIPYPFSWQMMDNESVDIVAAADGEVIQRFDGNSFDRNCASPHSFVSEPFNGGYYGNFIALMHSDSSITIYAHMKNGTVANLELGDFVETGQFLGKMGSSGNSTAPHIHFEVRPCEGCQYIEPWFEAGGCNDDVTETQWISQIPYSDPKVLRVASHLNLPVYEECAGYEAGNNEQENLVNHFTTANNLLVTVAIGDLLWGETVYFDIINSAGVIVDSETFLAGGDDYSATILFTQPLTGYANGTYRLRATYMGDVASHYITVGCPAGTTLAGAVGGTKGYITGDYINSTATIAGLSTNNIFYQAENYVNLKVGFIATSNSKFHAQIDDCTVGGMREETEEQLVSGGGMNISPNPTFGIFNVEYTGESDEQCRVLVRSVLGNIVFQEDVIPYQNQVNLNIELSEIAKGIYLVELQQSGKSISQQLVIQ
jgi:murein DD-endopeptidase MepM/ murein hydrolase activator NlpD